MAKQQSYEPSPSGSNLAKDNYIYHLKACAKFDKHVIKIKEEALHKQINYSNSLEALISEKSKKIEDLLIRINMLERCVIDYQDKFQQKVHQDLEDY